MNKPNKVFGITGWKNAGKTTLVSALVREFTNKGLKVSTVKHAHHSFDIDQEGKDSWQHRQSGASEVALVSKNRWALMSELRGDAEPSLDEILNKLNPCDLALVEGYKKEPHPKIEVYRNGISKGEPLWPNDPSIIALATDDLVQQTSIELLQIDDIANIANFILKHLDIES